MASTKSDPAFRLNRYRVRESDGVASVTVTLKSQVKDQEQQQELGSLAAAQDAAVQVLVKTRSGHGATGASAGEHFGAVTTLVTLRPGEDAVVDIPIFQRQEFEPLVIFHVDLFHESDKHSATPLATTAVHITDDDDKVRIVAREVLASRLYVLWSLGVGFIIVFMPQIQKLQMNRKYDDELEIVYTACTAYLALDCLLQTYAFRLHYLMSTTFLMDFFAAWGALLLCNWFIMACLGDSTYTGPELWNLVQMREIWGHVFRMLKCSTVLGAFVDVLVSLNERVSRILASSKKDDDGEGKESGGDDKEKGGDSDEELGKKSKSKPNDTKASKVEKVEDNQAASGVDESTANDEDEAKPSNSASRMLRSISGKIVLAGAAIVITCVSTYLLSGSLPSHYDRSLIGAMESHYAAEVRAMDATIHNNLFGFDSDPELKPNGTNDDGSIDGETKLSAGDGVPQDMKNSASLNARRRNIDIQKYGHGRHLRQQQLLQRRRRSLSEHEGSVDLFDEEGINDDGSWNYEYWRQKGLFSTMEYYKLFNTELYSFYLQTYVMAWPLGTAFTSGFSKVLMAENFWELKPNGTEVFAFMVNDAMIMQYLDGYDFATNTTTGRFAQVRQPSEMLFAGYKLVITNNNTEFDLQTCKIKFGRMDDQLRTSGCQTIVCVDMRARSRALAVSNLYVLLGLVLTVIGTLILVLSELMVQLLLPIIRLKNFADSITKAIERATGSSADDADKDTKDEKGSGEKDVAPPEAVTAEDLIKQLIVSYEQVLREPLINLATAFTDLEKAFGAPLSAYVRVVRELVGLIDARMPILRGIAIEMNEGTLTFSSLSKRFSMLIPDVPAAVKALPQYQALRLVLNSPETQKAITYASSAFSLASERASETVGTIVIRLGIASKTTSKIDDRSWIDVPISDAVDAMRSKLVPIVQSTAELLEGKPAPADVHEYSISQLIWLIERALKSRVLQMLQLMGVNDASHEDLRGSNWVEEAERLAVKGIRQKAIDAGVLPPTIPAERSVLDFQLSINEHLVNKSLAVLERSTSQRVKFTVPREAARKLDIETIRLAIVKSLRESSPVARFVIAYIESEDKSLLRGQVRDSLVELLSAANAQFESLGINSNNALRPLLAALSTDQSSGDDEEKSPETEGLRHRKISEAIEEAITRVRELKLGNASNKSLESAISSASTALAFAKNALQGTAPKDISSILSTFGHLDGIAGTLNAVKIPSFEDVVEMLKSANIPPAVISLLGETGGRAKKLWATANSLSRGKVLTSIRELAYQAMAHEGILALTSRSGASNTSSGSADAMTVAIRTQAEQLMATVRASFERLVAQLQAAVADLALNAAPVDTIRRLASQMAEKVDVKTVHDTALSILSSLPLDQAKALGASALAHARPLGDALLERWATTAPVDKLRGGVQALLERLDGTTLVEVISSVNPAMLPADWDPSAGNGLAAASKARMIEAVTSAQASAESVRAMATAAFQQIRQDPQAAQEAIREILSDAIARAGSLVELMRSVADDAIAKCAAVVPMERLSSLAQDSLAKLSPEAHSAALANISGAIAKLQGNSFISEIVTKVLESVPIARENLESMLARLRQSIPALADSAVSGLSPAEISAMLRERLGSASPSEAAALLRDVMSEYTISTGGAEAMKAMFSRLDPTSLISLLRDHVQGGLLQAASGDVMDSMRKSIQKWVSKLDTDEMLRAIRAMFASSRSLDMHHFREMLTTLAIDARKVAHGA